MATGVWIIGARGNVASVSIAGARAIANDVTETTGMVTAREPMASMDLPAIEDLVFGGHDIRTKGLDETIQEIQDESGLLSREIADVIRDDLQEINGRIRIGTARRCGDVVENLSEEANKTETTVAELVSQIQRDYATFAREQELDRLVVVNAASTEPPIANPEEYETLDAFETAVENDDRSLPASALYAYAAIADGHPYVNFTPSTGSSLGGLRELARQNNVPHMGRDGKTGETLMKSALAPMFAGRNLRVLSWEGHNILGNRDGLVLEDDANKAGKIKSKGTLLQEILGYETHNAVRIDYTPSMGDWKTAWDHIHFQGFLETEMKMQFIWEGADSALAAPLVLDLVRLVAFADEYGEGGVQPHLASFFKSPENVDEHDLGRQFRALYDYAEQHTGTHE